MKVGEVREGYIAKWKTYPTDEVKIRVARPSVLGPSKELLIEFKGKIEKFLKEYELSGRDKRWARLFFWGDYTDRYCEEIRQNPKAMKKILEITALVLNGKNVRLICYEKEFPCHRFILKEMIEEKVSAAMKEISKHANNAKA